MNVFEKLDERNGDAKSSSELANMTGADPLLMGGPWQGFAEASGLSAA